MSLVSLRCTKNNNIKRILSSSYFSYTSHLPLSSLESTSRSLSNSILKRYSSSSSSSINRNKDINQIKPKDTTITTATINDTTTTTKPTFNLQDEINYIKKRIIKDPSGSGYTSLYRFIEMSINKNRIENPSILNEFKYLLESNRLFDQKYTDLMARAFCEFGKPEWAIALVKDRRKGYDAGISTCEVIIHTLTKMIKRANCPEHIKRSLKTFLNSPLNSIFTKHTYNTLAIEAYLALDEESEALAVFKRIDTSQLTNFYTPFHSILKYYLSKGRHFDSIAFFFENIADFACFLNTRFFIDYIIQFYRAGLNEQYIFEQLEEKKLFLRKDQSSLVQNMIVFYLETKRNPQAKELYARYIALGNPESPFVYFHFLRDAITRRDVDQAMWWIKECSKNQFIPNFAPVQKLAELFVDSNNVDQQLQEFISFITSIDAKRGLSSRLIVFNEFSANPKLAEFARQLIDKTPNKSLMTNHIIRHYLQIGQYERALLWYSRRVHEYQLVANHHTVFNFIIYHRQNNQLSLIEFWERIRSGNRIDRSVEKKIVDEYETFSFIKDCDTLSRWNDSALDTLLSANPVTTSNTNTTNSNINNLIPRRMEKPLDIKLTHAIDNQMYSEITDTLLEYFKNTTLDEQIPVGTALLDAIVLLNEHNNKLLAPFIHGNSTVSPQIRSIIFNPLHFSLQFRDNLDSLESLSAYKPHQYILSSNIWNNLIIGLLRLDGCKEAVHYASEIIKFVKANHLNLLISTTERYCESYTYQPELFTNKESLAIIYEFATSIDRQTISLINFTLEYLIKENNYSTALQYWRGLKDRDIRTVLSGITLVSKQKNDSELPTQSFDQITNMNTWESLLPGITKCTPTSFYGALAIHVGSSLPFSEQNKSILTQIVTKLLSFRTPDFQHVLSLVAPTLTVYPDQAVRLLEHLSRLDNKSYQKLKSVESTNEKLATQLKNLTVTHSRTHHLKEKTIKIINRLFEDYKTIVSKEREK